VVAKRRIHLLRLGDQDRGLRGDQLHHRPEGVDREDLRDIDALSLVSRELRQLAVLERELGGGRQLDPLGLSQRALREGREPADRLDLVPEQLRPRRAFLGRREDVEDVPAHGELPAFLDLLDVLVSGLDQTAADLGQIDLVADRDREPGGSKRRVRDPLGEGDGAGDDHRVVLAGGAGERVERGDPKADQVRRRRQVRLVSGSPGGVVPDPARRQVRAQRPGEVAGGDVVGSDDQRRPPAEPLGIVQQRRQQVGADRPRRVGLGPIVAFRAGSVGQAPKALVLVGDLKQ
jgi:hypothetical protein